MESFAFKRYIKLPIPNESDSRADRERILDAIDADNVQMTLRTLQKLYPALQESGYKITLTLCPSACGFDIVNVEAGDTTASLYGLALDVGSTTLQMALIDMNNGETLCEHGASNSQRILGDDILTRIIAVKSDRANLLKLQTLVLDDIRALIQHCCAEAGISPSQIAALTVGGNTTMMHFLLGCDPWLVFQSPYAPVFYNPGIIPAWELGLELNCNLFIMPAVANYLGGDITSGLLNTDIDTREDMAMFLDIGTNGELALGCKGILLVGAGAAGPALEGAVSQSGMLSEPGAIDHVRIDENNALHIETSDNLPPKGICGSGIIDLIAQGYLAGWINGNGTLNPEASDCIKSVWDDEKNKRIPAIEYAIGECGPLYFTQDDIHEYILCKAAAHTMVKTLMDASGITASDIGSFYLAGGFGTHYDLESAITVGLYPDLPRDKFVVLGNASLEGCKRLLLDRNCLKRLQTILDSAVYVQFSEMDKFLENMVAAQFLPHTDATMYPSVCARTKP